MRFTHFKPFYSDSPFTVDVIIDYEGIQIDCKLKLSTETLENKLGLRLIVIHLEFSSFDELPSHVAGVGEVFN